MLNTIFEDEEEADALEQKISREASLGASSRCMIQSPVKLTKHIVKPVQKKTTSDTSFLDKRENEFSDSSSSSNSSDPAQFKAKDRPKMKDLTLFNNAISDEQELVLLKSNSIKSD